MQSRDQYNDFKQRAGSEQKIKIIPEIIVIVS